MRIISKFHDYYDPIQSIGYDPELIYKRMEREEEKSVLPPFSDSFLTAYDRWRFRFLGRGKGAMKLPPDTNLFFVGFCGKFYVGMIQSVRNKGELCSKEYFFYNGKEAQNFKHNKKEYKGLTLLGEPAVNPFADNIEPFRAINAPCFVIHNFPFGRLAKRNGSFTVDPILRELQFYKVFDSYSAYQEIAMFLSGVLGWPENATVDISDTDMRDAKGFDDWSFKTRPTKKLDNSS